jgi:DNA polymerase V
MTKHQIFEITNKRIYLPVAGSTIQAGFPSPAAEYEDDSLDINDIVVSNPSATFYVRVKGNSMLDANINDGDILVVDRSIEASHGKIVIAVVDGDFTVKTLFNKDGLVKLIPANPEFPEIVFNNQQELNVWGVVSYIIHKT